MIRHYLTFAHQAAVLDEALVGWTLAACWSQEKNRLALHLIRGRDSLFVEVAVDLRLGYALLARDIHRARKNTIDFFDELLGARVTGVAIDDGERAIRIALEEGRSLAIFFFGPGSGNVLAIDRGRVLSSFQKYEGEYDAMLEGSAPESLRGRREIREMLAASEEAPARVLARAIPAAGPRIIREALDRAGVASVERGSLIPAPGVDRVLDQIDAIYQECELSESYYLYHLPSEVVFTLTRLGTLDREAREVETFEEIARAIRVYRSSAFGARRFSELQTRMLKRAEGERGHLIRSAERRSSPEEQAHRAAEWELFGSLLLAHLHEIPAGTSGVTLADYEGIERMIPLEATSTIVENAERYFRRARGAREAIETSRRRGERTAQALRALEETIAAIRGAMEVGELEEIQRNNKELFTMSSEPKDPGTAERYRKFVLPGGHEVYVGKNAANNDELTVRFARANDYWFHARGISGSHVVLRWSDAKSKPPKEAIRGAASLAAYYSGARNGRNVPVAYTLKKYVRKPKGAAPGSVVMEREEVIMVEPKLPEGSVE